MSGHTNRNKRNKRNGGNPPKRGPDGRTGQSSQSGPLNQPGQSSQSKSANGSSTSGVEKQPRVEATAESATPPAHPEPREAPAAATPADESPASAESATPAEQAETPSPRGKTSFAAARGTHAYIPASGPRMGVNGAGGPNGNAGQNGANGQGGPQTQPGQNGYHRVSSSFNGNGHNGHAPMERRLETFSATDSAGMDDDGEGDFAGPIPQSWRTERLNGGTDTTPREPFRPESRGEVGSLIDTLHDLFAQDRAVASRGDATRCGICYLHFPLADLEYREAEGFYVCSGCKRALGHLSLMMIRRQQTPHNG